MKLNFIKITMFSILFATSAIFPSTDQASDTQTTRTRQPNITTLLARNDATLRDLRNQIRDCDGNYDYTVICSEALKQNEEVWLAVAAMQQRHQEEISEMQQVMRQREQAHKEELSAILQTNQQAISSLQSNYKALKDDHEKNVAALHHSTMFQAELASRIGFITERNPQSAEQEPPLRTVVDYQHQLRLKEKRIQSLLTVIEQLKNQIRGLEPEREAAAAQAATSNSWGTAGTGAASAANQHPWKAKSYSFNPAQMIAFTRALSNSDKEKIIEMLQHHKPDPSAKIIPINSGFCTLSQAAFQFGNVVTLEIIKAYELLWRIQANSSPAVLMDALAQCAEFGVGINFLIQVYRAMIQNNQV